jgi:hypothetical protein
VGPSYLCDNGTVEDPSGATHPYGLSVQGRV